MSRKWNNAGIAASSILLAIIAAIGEVSDGMFITMGLIQFGLLLWLTSRLVIDALTEAG